MANPERELDIEKLCKLLSSAEVFKSPDVIQISKEIVGIFEKNNTRKSTAIAALALAALSSIQVCTTSKRQKLTTMSLFISFLVTQSSYYDEE